MQTQIQKIISYKIKVFINFKTLEIFGVLMKIKLFKNYGQYLDKNGKVMNNIFQIKMRDKSESIF